ncbi:MAG: S1C family serine protease [Chitinophagaceae bacterium]
MKTSYLNFLLFVCVMILPILSHAQMSDSQSLAKYSYPIFAVTGDQQYTGTAFFYRSGDTTYLVSNYHAIKGMSPLKKTITFNIDTLYLKYPVKNSNEFKVIGIDISEEITGKTEIFSMVSRIDLLKIPVETPGDADIFFINDLIDEDYLDKEPEEVFVFGYPTDPGSIPAFYSQQQRLEGKVNPNGFTDYDASLRLNFPATTDNARAILGGTSRYYYFIRPYAAQGYSGAPVFGKFRNADNEVIYRFTGVIFAGQPTTRQTWAIKGAIALKYLQGEL